MDRVENSAATKARFSQGGSDQPAQLERRSFLTSAGAYGFAVPPTMALLLSTTMNSPAIAVSGNGVTPAPDGGGGGGGPVSGSAGGGAGGASGMDTNNGLGRSVGSPQGGPSLTEPGEVLGAPENPIDVFDAGGSGAPGPGNPTGRIGPRVTADDILRAGERG